MTVQNLLSKAWVCVLWSKGFLTERLQSEHPAGGSMTVLQYHPGALLDGFELLWVPVLDQGRWFGSYCPPYLGHPQISADLMTES